MFQLLLSLNCLLTKPISLLLPKSLISSIIFLIFLFIGIFFNKPIHSIGTLLHAGPSCVIKPQSRLINGIHQFLLNDYTQIKHRGICYSTLFCKQKGGVAIGKCGIGNSCCVFPQTCNSILIRNSTYFTSPEYPSFISNETKEIINDNKNYEYNNDDLSIINEQLNNNNGHYDNKCFLTIHRMPGIYPICQLRLDIIEYEIDDNHHKNRFSQYYNNGCRYIDVNNDNKSNISYDNDNKNDFTLDWITIKTINNIDIIKPLCPTSLIGQYVIVDVQQHIGPFYLTINTGSWSNNHRSRNYYRRRWNILINQIECNNNNRNNDNNNVYNNNNNERRILTNIIDT